MFKMKYLTRVGLPGLAILSACCCVLCLLQASPLHAQPILPALRMQGVPQPYDQVSFQRDGVEITRCHFAPTLKRPFLFPLIGPSGQSLTRMGHPHDPVGHSHHNSVWISHHDVQGVNFWGDTGKGRIVHQKIEKLTDGEREHPSPCSMPGIDEANKRRS